MTGKTQLFNLDEDIAEQHDLADENPEVVKRLEGRMAAGACRTSELATPRPST